MARSRCPNLPHPVRVRPRQVHPPQGLRLFHATLGRGHLHGPMNAVDLTVQTRTEVAHLAPGALLSGGAGGFRGRNKRWGRGGRSVTQRRAASAGWSGGRLGAGLSGCRGVGVSGCRGVEMQRKLTGIAGLLWQDFGVSRELVNVVGKSADGCLNCAASLPGRTILGCWPAWRRDHLAQLRRGFSRRVTGRRFRGKAVDS